MRKAAATDEEAIADTGVRMRWARPVGFDRERALRWLGPAERTRADSISHGGLRDRFLLGRMLLREVAAEAGGIRPEEVRIVATCALCGAEHGRPRIEWPDSAGPAWSASLSSCPDLVVAAVAPAGTAVGIDVEPDRGAESRDREVERRRAVVELIGEPSRTAIRRWVRTEAVLKADGRGLRVEPDLVRFDGTTAHLDDRPQVYRVVDRRIDGFLVSVAVAGLIRP
jgi:4'-phosphopantetheinyl transferase